MKKKIMSLIMVLTVMCSMTFFTVSNACAAEMPEEPIIYGLDYYTGYLADEDEYDYYLLEVPADGKLTITGYTSSTIWNTDVQIRDIKTLDIIKETYIGTYTSKENTTKKIIELKRGTYYLTLHNSYKADYAFRIDYDFSSTTKAKVTSPGTGKIKITAPKGSNVNGFEIRYKVSGASTWTNKTIEGNNTLNTTLKKMKSGKKYYVQTRKYVYDEYGYKYYSPWTERQSVTVK